ncbi:unnamed protein product, partial [Closterium sp. NIES-54]
SHTTTPLSESCSSGRQGRRRRRGRHIPATPYAPPPQMPPHTLTTPYSPPPQTPPHTPAPPHPPTHGCTGSRSGCCRGQGRLLLGRPLQGLLLLGRLLQGLLLGRLLLGR